MKILLIISLSFGLSSQSLSGQTKTEILKFNIEKVITHTVNGNWNTVTSAYYDKNGNQTKNEFSDSIIKFIIDSDYSDSLLIKQTKLKYEMGKLVERKVTIFTYDFDTKGRIIESKVITDSVTRTINRVIYNKAGDYDTVYYYRNYNNGQNVSIYECCRYVYKDGKTLSYCYDSIGWKSPNVKITEFFISDTLKTYLTKECNLKDNNLTNCKSNLINIYYTNGRIVKYEDEKQGILNVEIYEENKQGLIKKHIAKNKSPNYESTQIETMEYYFRH